MRLALPPVLRRFWPARRGEQVRPSAGETTALVVTVPSAENCQFLRSVVEAADDGLIACDAGGRLTLVNPAAAGLLQVEPLRDGALDAWPVGVLRLRPALERALAEGYAVVELEVERGDRTLVLEARANSALAADGSVEGAVLVLRDVTRLRELAAARADGWERLAHDLKTPLNSIGGFTTLLLQEAVGPLNPLQRDFLRTIEQEGHRLIEAVQGLLDDARVGGAERLSTAELRFQAVADETVDRLRSLAVRKSIQLEVDVSTELPSVVADREKLGLVLMNLLDNAISFTREGGRISLRAREVGDQLEVSVQDGGVGIPADSLELVFGRYYRAPNQPAEGRPGIGLGLAICKQIVERHGGRIWAENAPEGGARLAFTLPIVYKQARLEALGAAW